MTDPADEGMREGFLGITARELSAMSDLQLAEWQANQKPGSPQFILAENV